MMFTKGQYLKKKDGNRISKANKFPVFKVNDCRINPEVEGGLIVNSVMKILPEWFEVITEEEYNTIRNDPKYSSPAQAIQPKTKITFVEVGQYIRKKNWEFIKDQPAIKVKSASTKNLMPHQIRINGIVFETKSVVILAEEEYNQILIDWNNTQISPAIEGGKLETVHYREDTGEEKQQRDIRHAREYVFTYNKKFPGKDMNAYECIFCKQIHCGKVPKPEANISTGKFLPEELEVMNLSSNLFKRIKTYFPKTAHLYDWQKMYDNNTRLKLGNYDIVATQRHFDGGWVKLYEIIPEFIKRYDMSLTRHDVNFNSWKKNDRGMRTVFMPDMDTIKYVLQEMINRCELNKIQKFKLFAKLLFKKSQE